MAELNAESSNASRHHHHHHHQSTSASSSCNSDGVVLGILRLGANTSTDGNREVDQQQGDRHDV